jgi:hypothetical protein
MAFEEINERYRVSGIMLEFDDDEPEHLRVVFRPAPKYRLQAAAPDSSAQRITSL